MKRFVALLMAMVLLMTLTACENEKAEKYCWNCGEGITKEASFCPSCGTEQGATGSTTTTSTTVKTTANPKVTTTKKPVTTTQKPTTKATTAPIPTTTIHTHTYVNYVCSGCGTVDKSCAYEYLTEWVKKNGKVHGEFVSVYEYDYDHEDNTTWQYGISYSASMDYLYVSSAFYDDNNERNNLNIIIYLSSKTKNFDYQSSAGTTQNRLAYAKGKIDGKTYTTNSPITCEEYDGVLSNRSIFLEDIRIMAKVAILFLDDYLTRMVPEIDIKDIGFANF